MLSARITAAEVNATKSQDDQSVLNPDNEKCLALWSSGGPIRPLALWWIGKYKIFT
jgi:hypothetical protein